MKRDKGDGEDGRLIVDCHVNVYEDRHVLPYYHEAIQVARPGAIGHGPMLILFTRRCPT